MLTAMLTVENILGASHDVWAVNVDDEYHEESRPSEEVELGGTPTRRPGSAVRAVLSVRSVRENPTWPATPEPPGRLARKV